MAIQFPAISQPYRSLQARPQRFGAIRPEKSATLPQPSTASLLWSRVKNLLPKPGLISSRLQGLPLAEQARIAVDWYDARVEKIPALERGDRKNFGIHLRMIEEITALLPPAKNAVEMQKQYAEVFDTLEKKVAVGDFRMQCEFVKALPLPGKPNVVCTGAYILVFGANGAMEIFHRKIPDAAAIKAPGQTNYAERMRHFHDTDYDARKLGFHFANDVVNGVPDFLRVAHYERCLVKPGADGLDAWSRPANISKLQCQRQKSFEIGE